MFILLCNLLIHPFFGFAWQFIHFKTSPQNHAYLRPGKSTSAADQGGKKKSKTPRATPPTGTTTTTDSSEEEDSSLSDEDDGAHSDSSCNSAIDSDSGGSCSESGDSDHSDSETEELEWEQTPTHSNSYWQSQRTSTLTAYAKKCAKGHWRRPIFLLVQVKKSTQVQRTSWKRKPKDERAHAL